MTLYEEVLRSRRAQPAKKRASWKFWKISHSRFFWPLQRCISSTLTLMNAINQVRAVPDTRFGLAASYSTLTHNFYSYNVLLSLLFWPTIILLMFTTAWSPVKFILRKSCSLYIYIWRGKQKSATIIAFTHLEAHEVIHMNLNSLIKTELIIGGWVCLTKLCLGLYHFKQKNLMLFVSFKLQIGAWNSLMVCRKARLPVRATDTIISESINVVEAGGHLWHCCTVRSWTIMSGSPLSTTTD